MDVRIEARAGGISQVVACAAIGIAGGAAIGAYAWLAYRGVVPRPGNSGLEAACAVVALGMVGVAAGMVSRGWQTAIGAWLAAITGAVLAYAANYALDPGWPTSETPLWLSIVEGALISLPLIGGGHRLGALARQRLGS